jgi:hypothetical protein
MHPQDKSGGDFRAPSSQKFVPFILSDEHREALRDDCMNGLQAILADLKTPTRLRDPIANAVEAEVFRRLLEALDTEQIQVPDEEMRERMGRLAASYDEMENVEEVMTFHDAHELLLGILDGSREEGEGVKAPGPRWIADDDKDCRRELLDLLLSEAPHCLEFDDLAVALAGDPESLAERNALKDAVTILRGAGLVTRRRGALAPTRPARQMAELGFAVGC